MITYKEMKAISPSDLKDLITVFNGLPIQGI